MQGQTYIRQDINRIDTTYTHTTARESMHGIAGAFRYKMEMINTGEPRTKKYIISVKTNAAVRTFT
jgi:hypothetical protein